MAAAVADEDRLWKREAWIEMIQAFYYQRYMRREL